MNFLICTIVRNRAQRLPMWESQLSELTKMRPDDSFELSVYENDSDDDSLATLMSFGYEGFDAVRIKTETLNTPYFGSVQDSERVRLLANARNQCLDYHNLKKFDKIIFVEPDVEYKIPEVLEIINLDADIASGKTVTFGSDIVYDTWATRLNWLDKEWDNTYTGSGWIKVWSTFNGFCVYNAEPFYLHNARFSGGDCDTVQICKEFQNLGYSDVYFNMDIEILHHTDSTEYQIGI